MILYLFVLKRRRKDFAYHGIQSNKTLTSPNHIYSQNAVVQNVACISTRLKTIYFNDIKIQEPSIIRNTLYLNFILWVMSIDKKKLEMKIIRNQINWWVFNDSPNKKYQRIKDIGAIIWNKGTTVGWWHLLRYWRHDCKGSPVNWSDGSLWNISCNAGN